MESGRGARSKAELSGRVHPDTGASAAESGGHAIGCSARLPDSEKRLSQSLHMPTVGDEDRDDLAEEAVPSRGRGGPLIA